MNEGAMSKAPIVKRHLKETVCHSCWCLVHMSASNIKAAQVIVVVLVSSYALKSFKFKLSESESGFYD